MAATSPFVCAKCHLTLPATAYLNPITQMVHFKFSCHGTQSDMVMSMLELQEGHAYIVFPEYKSITVN